MPAGLLIAIARTESGRSNGEAGSTAWPWTSNIRGTGQFHDTREAALSHLRQVVADGEELFDVGCMQVNWYWHGDHFADLEAMIDPAQNVAYAARFLARLKDDTGSWDAAVGQYHSRDPAKAEAYTQRVRAALGELTGLPTVTSTSTEVAAPRRAPEDGRFARRAPLVTISRPGAYWELPSLDAGALPDFAPTAGE